MFKLYSLPQSKSNLQIKDVNYFGLDDEYVMSGSDDGILFICKPCLWPLLIYRGPKDVGDCTAVESRRGCDKRHDRASVLSCHRSFRDRSHRQNILPGRS